MSPTHLELSFWINRQKSHSCDSDIPRLNSDQMTHVISKKMQFRFCKHYIVVITIVYDGKFRRFAIYKNLEESPIFTFDCATLDPSYPDIYYQLYPDYILIIIKNTLYTIWIDGLDLGSKIQPQPCQGAHFSFV